jgi:hypothetical protein
MLSDTLDSTMDYRKSQIQRAKEMVSYGIRQSAQFLKGRIGQAETSVRVPPLILGTLTTTDSLLSSTKSVIESFYSKAVVVASTMQHATMTVGSYVSGYRVLKFFIGRAAGERVDSTFNHVINRSQEGTKEIFSMLTGSMFEIVDESKKAVSEVIEHRYGEEAGDAARKSINIVQNGVEAYLYWQYGTNPKTIMMASTMRPSSAQGRNLLTFNS